MWLGSSQHLFSERFGDSGDVGTYQRLGDGA